MLLQDFPNIHKQDLNSSALITRFADKIVLIQYSKTYNITKNLHLNMFKKAVDAGDISYLANLHDICQIFQTIFIASGCDFVSYFVRLKFYDDNNNIIIMMYFSNMHALYLGIPLTYLVSFLIGMSLLTLFTMAFFHFIDL